MSRSKDTAPVSASRERIIRAAAALFARNGFHGVTTRQIAAMAELNISTVHYHVGSKQDLYDTKYKEIEMDETLEAEIISYYQGASTLHKKGADRYESR